MNSDTADGRFQGIHVNPHALRTGANVSDDAASGDFDAPHSFHTALGSAKDDHRDALQDHYQNLTGIAENVRTAATTFTRMDNQNAELLRGVEVRLPAQ